MPRHPSSIGPIVFAVLAWLPHVRAQADDPPPKRVDYLRDIRPILSRHCLACHGADEEQRKAGLRLDTKDGATQALKSGATAVVPGDTDASDLVFRITEEDETVRMPPKSTGDRLKPEEIRQLTRWVAQGAPYAQHWAFVAPEVAPLPEAGDPARVRNSIDSWVQKRVQDAGLAPSPEAERAILARRLSLDLRGLPPTPAEVESFVSDPSPAAYAKLVDRWLADPAYGERWARMWLDLARYADSAGLGSDPLRPNMWRYRDWVIAALNRNQPYDQSVVEQLAGDLLPNATLEQKVATAFHRNTMTNTEGGTDDEEFRVAAVKDRVDTTGQVFMGLTFGCAKCHNHKYDPLSQREYYQLFAFFNQTADNDQPDESPTLPAPTLAQANDIARVEAKIAGLTRVLNRSTPELSAAQEAWERKLGTTVTWTPLAIESVRGQEGTSYKVTEGAIQALGPNPDNEVISIAATADAIPSAIRLETLPDPSSPSGGAGRADDGNFVLSHVALETEPLDAALEKPLARFVRIVNPGAGKLLSLAEVEIFSGGENVAARGKAAQSSTAYGGAPARAIDGNTNGQYFQANSTTHTGNEENPWWELTLTQPTPVDRLVVWNRTDGGLESRLAGFTVELLDENRKLLWRSEQNPAPMPSLELTPSGRKGVRLLKAVADFSQGGFPIEQAIGPAANPKTGWAIAPRFKEKHEATFVTESQSASEGARRLVLRLEHKYERARFTLGRLRLSVSFDPQIRERAAVPAEMLAIVDTPADHRTPDQSAALAKHFRSIAPELQPLRDEIAAFEKMRPIPAPVPVMAELPTEKRRTTRLMHKGNFLDPGDPVEARTPSAFHTLPADAPANRLGLARWIVDPNNTLTARVAVNRIWAQLFGLGLVETEEDFGSQGELPSHPELLDWLAIHYRDSGWDTKDLIRTIVLSATYRQASQATPEQLANDPRNRLLSRMPRVRLEAEMVRDQALALSGLLCRKIGGPSVYPPQPDGLWQAAFNGERTWNTSKGEDRYRRGLYTFWRRTVPYPSMATFDAPSRETCAIKRVRTNTPLQAFVTLNDPAYVEAAQALARRIDREGGGTTEDRARFALALCLGRAPADDQVHVIVRLFEAEKVRFESDHDAARSLATEPLGPLPDGANLAEFAAWTSVANVLLNLDGVLTKG